MSNDNDKINELLVANEGFARWAANRWKFGGELDYEERLASARIGLWLAIKRWDPERGTLATFASRWMHGEIVREVAAVHEMRPSTFHRALSSLRAERKLLLLEPDAGDAELSKAIGCQPETREAYRAAMARRVELDEPLSEDGEATIAGTFVDEVPSPLDALLRTELLGLLDELDWREYEIVTGHLLGEAIGSAAESLGISQSRAYQIFNEGISKLRRLLADRDPEVAARLDGGSAKRTAA